jgi:hypothetical protein
MGTPPVDTDTASREELAKACAVLHRWWTHVGKTLHGQDEALAACGLSCDVVPDFPLTIVDRDKAVAWFERALAAFDRKQREAP